MRLKNVLLAGIAGLALSAAANATTITQNVQFGPGPTDYNNATGITTNGASATTLSLFDTTLGTLNSISFSSSYGFTSTITVTNTSTSASTGNARTQSAAQFGSGTSSITSVLNSKVNSLNDPVDGTGVSFGTSSLSPIAFDVRGNVTSYSLPAGGTLSFGSTGSGAAGPTADTAAADLAAFSAAGGGSFTPLFTTLSGLVISNSGGNTTATQVTTATGTLTISYNYTVPPPPPPPTTVPEPASIALLGLGLAGIGVLRRRTKK